MIETTILIPLVSNDGDTFSPAHHQAFERFVLDRFGGFTWLPGTAVGGWVDGEVTYLDETRLMLVLVDGLLARSEALHEVLDFAKRHYRQEAVTVRYLGEAEII